MPQKFQSTNLHLNVGRAVDRLELWGRNPWRRYSLYMIFLLIGFLIGSSIGMINGVLALMDPVGAFFTVLLIELLVRLRRGWRELKLAPLLLNCIDMLRIGLLNGLFMEAFKLF